MLKFKERQKIKPSNFLLMELLGAPVSKLEWANALVKAAAEYRTMQSAMLVAFNLNHLWLSPDAWVLVRKASLTLDPPPPELIFGTLKSATVYICENFVNAGACIRAGNLTEATKWVMSGKDKKRMAMPRKKSTGPRRMTSRFMITGLRERDDSTAWNKCK